MLFRCVALVSLSVLLAATAVRAEEPLVSNRPGFSNVWEVVQPGRVEVNAGLQFDRIEEDEAFSFGQVLVRAGITERLEARIGLNSYVDLQSPSGDSSGLQDPTLGLKWQLLESGGPGWGCPAAALILQTTVPAGDEDLGTEDPQPGALLVLSWDPSRRVHLDTNHGFTYVDAGSERGVELFASYGAAISLVGKLAGYLELATFVGVDGPVEDRSYLFGAFTYLASPRMQLDIGVGRGLNSADPEHFVSTGVAYRW